jgi:hypothetical protein
MSKLDEIELTDELITKWLNAIPEMKESARDYPALQSIAILTILVVCEAALIEVGKLRLENEETRKVIEPFAKGAEKWSPDDETIISEDLPFSPKDIRASTTFLAKYPEEKK